MSAAVSHHNTNMNTPNSANASPTSVVPSSSEADHMESLLLAEFYLTKPAPNGMASGSIGQKRSLQQDAWSIPASKKARRTTNPIKSTVDQVTRRIRLGVQRRDRKNPISIASCDTSHDSSIAGYQPAIDTVIKSCQQNHDLAGYSHACGSPMARKAIASHHSYPEVRIRPDNVIVTNGCSGALNLALNALLDEDSTVLVPQPGFPLYEEIAKSIGAKVVHYHLNPDQDWECDMEHLEELMTVHTNVRTIVINNPSSSTGSVFSEEHLCEIIDFASKHHLPIVSDEIYGDLTFGLNNTFYPLARIAARHGHCEVPVITTSGVSKQFLLAGWRVGWLCFHDNVYGSLRQVQAGAMRLAQLHHGTSSLAQAAIPSLLNPTSSSLKEWKEGLKTILKRRADLLCSRIEQCPGLQVSTPQGAMYAIVQIDTALLGVEHDMELAMRLVDEENVFVLPGSALGVRNVFRVAFGCPEHALEAALRRIENFCHRHAKK